MSARVPVLLLLAACAPLAAGCVERMMLIRSEPAGAPVWVDEQYVGVTPVEQRFTHYGYRRIRVGPIRDEHDKVQYLEKELVVSIEAPWYQAFPIDFFFEVLYPGRLTDEQELPTWVLLAADDMATRHGTGQVEKLREQAEEFRRRSLYSIPEAAAE